MKIHGGADFVSCHTPGGPGFGRRIVDFLDTGEDSFDRSSACSETSGMAGLEESTSASSTSSSSHATFRVRHQDQSRYRQHQEHARSRHHPGGVRKGDLRASRFGKPGRETEAGRDCGSGSWGQLPIFRSHLDRKEKDSFSQRQRLRRAGALVDADAPLVGSQNAVFPRIKHRVKSTITFSERQRQRKKGLLRVCIREDEVLDAVDQLFPGTHVDYSPDPPDSCYDSDASDFSPVPLFSRLRLFLQRKDSEPVVVVGEKEWKQQPASPTVADRGLARADSSRIAISPDAQLFSFNSRVQSFEGPELVIESGHQTVRLDELVSKSGVGAVRPKSNLQQHSLARSVDVAGKDLSPQLAGILCVARAQEVQGQLHVADEEEADEEKGESEVASSMGRATSKLKLGRSGKRLLSGAIAGAVSRTAVAPLETIRTHLMVGSHGRSVKEVFQWIMAHEGWTGLFRGNAINVIRVAPSKAIELFAFESVKKALTPKEGQQSKIPLPISSVAGSAAGIAATVCMYPLELLKTRLTVQPEEYRGVIHALWRIVSEEGPFELYRGLVPSVIGIIPYAGANYFAYDTLRSGYKQVFKTEHVGNLETLLIGSAAGAFASTLTFPLEVARKQMQVGALKGRVVYRGTLHALSCIFQEQGLQGLYRGLGPSCLKLMPAAGLSFMTYEYLKRILEDEEQSVQT